jgi:hypothetical protein
MSTSSVNVGSQVMTWDYRQNASSSGFNRLYADIVPTGLYAGGKFERLNDTVISVKKMVVLIRSNEREFDKITVRIETTTDQDLSLATSIGGSSCDPQNSYIVARFGWEDVESDFMEILAVRYSDDPDEYRPNYIQAKDIILGKVLFEQVDTDWIIRRTHGFDYTRRQMVFIPTGQIAFREYRVQTCEEDPAKIHVTGGNSYGSKGFISTVGGNFPDDGIPPTEAQGRNDLVYVNAEGMIKIELGVPAASPVTPLYGSRRVIGEICRGPNRTDIIGDEIVQINMFGQMGTVEAGDFSLKDLDDYFTQKNVEAALKQTWEKTVTLQTHFRRAKIGFLYLITVITKFIGKIHNDLNAHVADIVEEGVVHGIEVIDMIDPLINGEEE